MNRIMTPGSPPKRSRPSPSPKMASFQSGIVEKTREYTLKQTRDRKWIQEDCSLKNRCHRLYFLEFCRKSSGSMTQHTKTVCCYCRSCYDLIRGESIISNNTRENECRASNVVIFIFGGLLSTGSQRAVSLSVSLVHAININLNQTVAMQCLGVIY